MLTPEAMKTVSLPYLGLSHCSWVSLCTPLPLGLWTPHTYHLLSVTLHPLLRSFPAVSFPMTFFHL